MVAEDRGLVLQRARCTHALEAELVAQVLPPLRAHQAAWRKAVADDELLAASDRPARVDGEALCGLVPLVEGVVLAAVIEARSDEEDSEAFICDIVYRHPVGAEDAFNALLVTETSGVLTERIVSLTFRRAQSVGKSLCERRCSHAGDDQRTFCPDPLTNGYVAVREACEALAWEWLHIEAHAVATT